MTTTRFPKIAALAAAVLFTVSAQAATYSANPNIAIPDGNVVGVSSSLLVPDTGLISALTVSVGIDHNWAGDLIITLSHGATTIKLLDRPGVPVSTVGTSVNLSSLYPLLFASTASAPAESLGTTPCLTNDTVGLSAATCGNTTFLPQESLAAFTNTSAAGEWVLRVSDNDAIIAGSLASWSLNLSTTPAPSTAVPEPGSLALAALSLGGLAFTRRRTAR